MYIVTRKYMCAAMFMRHCFFSFIDLELEFIFLSGILEESNFCWSKQMIYYMFWYWLQEGEDAAGNDGTLFGPKLFSCDPGHAMFVRLEAVERDERFTHTGTL